MASLGMPVSPLPFGSQFSGFHSALRTPHSALRNSGLHCLSALSSPASRWLQKRDDPEDNLSPLPFGSQFSGFTTAEVERPIWTPLSPLPFGSQFSGFASCAECDHACTFSVSIAFRLSVLRLLSSGPHRPRNRQQVSIAFRLSVLRLLKMTREVTKEINRVSIAFRLSVLRLQNMIETQTGYYLMRSPLPFGSQFSGFLSDERL